MNDMIYLLLCTRFWFGRYQSFVERAYKQLSGPFDDTMTFQVGNWR